MTVTPVATVSTIASLAAVSSGNQIQSADLNQYLNAVGKQIAAPGAYLISGGTLTQSGSNAVVAALQAVIVPAGGAPVIVNVPQTNLPLTNNTDMWVDLDNAGTFYVNALAHGSAAPALYSASCIRLFLITELLSAVRFRYLASRTPYAPTAPAAIATPYLQTAGVVPSSAAGLDAASNLLLSGLLLTIGGGVPSVPAASLVGNAIAGGSVALSAYATDTRGTMTITTPSAPGTGAMFAFNFSGNNPNGLNYAVVFGIGNGTTWRGISAGSKSQGGFTVYADSAPPANATISVDYLVVS